VTLLPLEQLTNSGPGRCSNTGRGLGTNPCLGGIDTVDQLSQLSDRWRTMAGELRPDSERAQTLNLCAGELDQFVRRSLADAVGASEDEQIRLDVAEVRVDAAAELYAPSVTASQKAGAARILAEVWTVGEEHGIRATDWLPLVDLPAVCLSAVRVAERRTGGAR
jgi:hypothetical protein